MAHYEQALRQVRYRNGRPATLSERRFRLTCSELNGRYTSNEFNLEVSFDVFLASYFNFFLFLSILSCLILFLSSDISLCLAALLNFLLSFYHVMNHFQSSKCSVNVFCLSLLLTLDWFALSFCCHTSFTASFLRIILFVLPV